MVVFVAGAIRVISFGSLVDAAPFYRDPTKGLATDVLVYPVGYKVERVGPPKEADGTDSDVNFTFEIGTDVDSAAPLFTISVADTPDATYTDTTPNGVWAQASAGRKKSTPASVLARFGLSDKRITEKLRGLPGGEELFAKLRGMMEQKSERPKRQASKPDQSLPRQVGQKKPREEATAVDDNSVLEIPDSSVLLNDDSVAIVGESVNVDAAPDALPAKKPRKPSAKKVAAGTGGDESKARRQLSLTEMLAGKSTVSGSDALKAMGPVLRPPCDKTTLTKAKSVFFQSFDDCKQYVALRAKLTGNKAAAKHSAQFLWQYTSEKTKMELAKKWTAPVPGTADATAEAAANPVNVEKTATPAKKPSRATSRTPVQAQVNAFGEAGQSDDVSMNIADAEGIPRAGRASARASASQVGSKKGSRAASSAKRSSVA